MKLSESVREDAELVKVLNAVRDARFYTWWISDRYHGRFAYLGRYWEWRRQRKKIRAESVAAESALDALLSRHTPNEPDHA